MNMRETPHGVRFRPTLNTRADLEVEATVEHARIGVVVTLRSQKHVTEVRVTPSGQMRLGAVRRRCQDERG